MKKLILALIASAAAMSAAHAEGPYAGVGVTTSRYNFGAANGTSSDDTSGYKVSGKVFGGYDFDKTWGLEAGYADLGSKSYSYTVGSAAGSLDAGTSAYYLAGKATAPLNDQFSLFGKLGVSRLHSSLSATGLGTSFGTTDNKTSAYAALGGQYALSKQVALSLEWERYGKNPDVGTKASAVTVAARYSF